MQTNDEKLESILADPWLGRPRTRWSLSLVFVIVVLVGLRPVIVRNLLARAEAYSSNGLYKNAARESNKAVFLDTSNIEAWNLLGSSYKNQDDLDNAVIAYLNAINVKPNNIIAHFRVAMIFAVEQNYNRAIPHFERVRYFGPETYKELAIDNFSYYRASLEMLSLCYERTGRTEKQQAVLKDLARTYPKFLKTSDELQSIKQSK